ncbi:MAG: S8 family serine peptidase [Flavobacteriaceae bacterium]|nr:MAG: S8 family serine peptidase [Flavobacteriaceae bacterium]
MTQKSFKKLIVCFFLVSSFSSFSQTRLQIEEIKKNYNLNKLSSLSETFKSNFLREKEKAIAMAIRKGWRIKYTNSNGTLYELMKVSEDGFPMYYKTDNSDAALSTRTNWLHNNGGLGLNLEGQGMTAYIWDGGLARSTHQEYDGAGGDNRYSIGDGTSTLSFHGAHVTGIIIASGVDAEAKGMTPQAKGIGHDWNNDESEITDAAANGMLLSNHSYGFALEDVSDWIAGAYISNSRNLDEILYNAPYYLNVTSAGNSGNDNTSNAVPLAGNASFDKLTGWSTSKNNLVVANAQDATINGDGTLNFVSINGGSSEGPTDDLRIKPDITGNGTSLHSTFESADNAYARISGTSMSSPNVCGSLLLLQQHYNNTQGVFMRAATLKGLALHTADDGSFTVPGPDATWGWGLLNAKKAAETITDRGLLSEIRELELSQGETHTLTVKADGVNPLIASISWTDVPGTAVSGVANDGTPVLVNDLDIRVSNTTGTFMPWRLTSVNTNDKGDNIVDPYERVDVGVGSGDYTITVTHKGTLTNGSQRFSLIVTGISSDFTIATTTSAVDTCTSGNALFNFNYRQSIPTTTNFTAENLPTGMTANFSTTSLSADGNFTVTFENLDGLDPGTYSVDIVGNNGNISKRETVQVRIFKDDFTNHPVVLSTPADGEREVSMSQTPLTWQNNINAQSYLVQVSDTPSFSTIIASGNETDTDFIATGLSEDTVYYWRVKPENTCGTNSSFSEIRSFQTGIANCSYTYTATDFSSGFVGGLEANEIASVPIAVTDNIVIDKLTASVTINHTNVSNLRVFIQEPNALGSNNIYFLNNPCDGTDNIDATFDDDGSVLSCSPLAPAITGTIAPAEKLSAERGKNAMGTWFIAMRDLVADDGGNIAAASITICTKEPNSSPPAFTSNVLTAVANASETIMATHMEATTASETAAQQVYTLVVAPALGSITKNGIPIIVSDTFTQEDINLGRMAFTNSQTSVFNDEFKVDILNGTNGWLPNQTVSISATASLDSFDLGSISVFPNPSTGEINVSVDTSLNDAMVLQLYDLQGRLIYASKDNTITTGFFSKKIDVNAISNGIYLLKIKQGNKAGIKKVIISK